MLKSVLFINLDLQPGGLRGKRRFEEAAFVFLPIVERERRSPGLHRSAKVGIILDDCDSHFLSVHPGRCARTCVGMCTWASERSSW